MSAAQNLTYAVIQVVHNFGAVATVGGSFSALAFRGVDTRKKLARIVLGGWCVQAASGATFGATSYYFYHQLPDIGRIATDALVIKMSCVAAGILLLATYILKSGSWSVARINGSWHASSTLAVIALSSAAVLRWFS